MEAHEKLQEGEDLYFAIEPNPEVEKALKDDFGSLLEFDKTVETYLVEPITVSYEIDSVQKFYTSNFLVRYFEPEKGRYWQK
jgi:hypothetical protein